jgi:hypothetical protein
MLLANLLFDQIRNQLPGNLAPLGRSQEILISHTTKYTLNIRITPTYQLPSGRVRWVSLLGNDICQLVFIQ